MTGADVGNTGDSRHFNSHAHVERDKIVAKFGVFKDISTHTLTWSVTFVLGVKNAATNISTHTLTWSVTSLSSYLLTVI